MKPHASLTRHAARNLLIGCLVATNLAALPAASSATSLAATHAPDGIIYVAIVTNAASEDITVSLSAGVVEGASGTLAQTRLGIVLAEGTRSVSLMEGG